MCKRSDLSKIFFKKHLTFNGITLQVIKQFILFCISTCCIICMPYIVFYFFRNCQHQLEEPSRVQLCILARDCLVSNWSNWTLWRRSVVSGEPRDKFVRTRKITQLPRGSGRACPGIKEIKVANLNEMRAMCTG